MVRGILFYMYFLDTMQVSKVYSSLWYFISERQKIFFHKMSGIAAPHTNDVILQTHKFTNVYRAADRTSQFAIRIMYDGVQTPEEIFFRTILFKFFNKIETWQRLEKRVGGITYETFDIEHYARMLDDLFAQDVPLYSAAYIMPSTSMYAQKRKHRSHLLLLADMMKDELPQRIAQAPSLEQVYLYLREYPTMGSFLAYQYTIDLNYSTLIDFSENEFVVAGPGAKDGIRKCFHNMGTYSEDSLIRALVENQQFESERLGYSFQNLFGRPLHLIDMQNVFCEIGKYARVAHPSVQGVSGRTKIKQQYRPAKEVYQLWFPPKWGIVAP
jgi:hypothetical protein